MNRAFEFAFTDAGQERVECPRCQGAGEVYPLTPVGFGVIPDPEACNGCMGKGHVSAWWAGQYRKSGGWW
jgi:DnaJ-class molecular chaperone